MQNMVILGATGSIGTSTLKVIATNPQAYKVYGLVAHASVEKMLALCLAHQPVVVHMVDAAAAQALKAQLPPALKIQVTSGADELVDLVTAPQVDTVMA
ncbi:MAG: 1-deoxy-D-xylulose-5-phosphate reductoisomerase, partial [Shewanella sp.]